MIIAFEGPDKVGKSTVARELSTAGTPIYNMTVHDYHDVVGSLQEKPDQIYCFDRIDWLTHLVYRLSMPSYEWNDDRVRRVFPAPETHLVIMTHKSSRAGKIQDELYAPGDLVVVNYGYQVISEMLLRMNGLDSDVQIFKSITMVEVDVDDDYDYKVLSSYTRGVVPRDWKRSVRNPATLLEYLQKVDELVGMYESILEGKKASDDH